MADRLGLREARAIVEAMLEAATRRDLKFAAAVVDAGRREITWYGDALYTPVWGGIVLRSRDGTMLGALGESGGTYRQDEEIGQLGAKIFADLRGS